MKKILLLFLMSFVLIVSSGTIRVQGAIFDLMDGGGGSTTVIEGEMTIYSDETTNSSASSSGSLVPLFTGTHSFIYVENTGNTSFYLGVYSLDPGEFVTIGVYGNRDEYHIGVWYNLEAQLYYDISAYTGSVSLTMSMDEDDIDDIDEYIDDNNVWTLDFNCASFASEIWNLVSSTDLDAYNSTLGYDTPKELAHSIEEVSGYQSGILFTVGANIDDYVGYYGYDENDEGIFVACLP